VHQQDAYLTNATCS